MVRCLGRSKLRIQKPNRVHALKEKCDDTRLLDPLSMSPYGSELKEKHII